MKVALVQMPHFYGSGQSRPPENYPLGLGYIAAVAKAAGVECDGVDLWSAGVQADEALERLDFSGFDAVGVSAYSTQYRYLKAFSLGFKERHPTTPLICGGPGPTFSADVILGNTGVDVCVLGEGEVTFLELLDRLDDPGSVAGLAYLEDGGVVRTPEREYVRALDTFPEPDRTLFGFEQVIATADAMYRATDRRKPPRRSADIIAGRGCPYRCRYCSKTFRGCRLRSVDAIVAEAESLRDGWGVDHLAFNDELVLVSRKRSFELAERLGATGLKWSCQGRVDQVDADILAALKAAGCEEIGYGVESATQAILDAMDKQLDARQLAPVIKMTRAAGIHPIVQYMFGYPGEDDDSIEATVRFFEEIDHPFIAFTTTPIPGSPLYNDCLGLGYITDEEDYLLRLDSGYNLQGAMVNLTEFTDEEFLAKKRALQYRVTHNYLKRRPLRYVRYLADLRRLFRFGARFFGRAAALLFRSSTR